MHKTTRFFLPVAIALLLGTITSTSRAQIDCSDDESNCTPWSVLLTKTGGVGTCNITVYYYMRVCNGVLQCKYDHMSQSGDCSFWKDTSAQQLADIIMMRNAMNLSLNPPYNLSIPYCPTTAQQVEFITSDCYIWQKCTYNTTNDPPVCDPPENPQPPAPGGTVDVWTWHPCGQSCCKRTYTVCVEPGLTGLSGDDVDLNLHRYHITITSKQRIKACEKNQDGTWIATCNDGC